MTVPLVLVLAALAAAGCAHPAPASARPPAEHAPDPERDPALLAVLWMQHAAERDAICRQTFRAARAMLDAALADPQWTAALEQTDAPDVASLPPAILVDVDETVLDNSAYNARNILTGRKFDLESWAAWTAEAQAPPLPGAVEFLTAAAHRGVTIFYVTNRRQAEEPATRQNLARHGFPLLDRDGVDVVLCRGEHGDDPEKVARRARVAATHRILMLIGDDLNDFLPGVRPTPADERHAVASRRSEGHELARARRQRVGEFAEWFGVRWFLLPNPLYGSWLYTLEAAALPDDGADPVLHLQLCTRRVEKLPAAR
ncbi:MAG TPA: HAD family acid phosphatase [Planctomycetota bacterium]|nr:HAD family acid phosphatase [Planctomycetota bacterium]